MKSRCDTAEDMLGCNLTQAVCLGIVFKVIQEIDLRQSEETAEFGFIFIEMKFKKYKMYCKKNLKKQTKQRNKEETCAQKNFCIALHL